MATIKYWDGSAWQYAVVGKQGPVGPTGPTGPAGATGATGATGPSALTTKGDLATFSTTTTRLAVGNNGETLVADSSTTTGLKWQAPTVNTVIDAKGDLLAGIAADTIARLPLGSNGQVLKVNTGTATGLEWAADSSGMTNPMTTTGDIIYSSPNSTPVRRAIGSTGQVLTVSGGVPTWATPATPATNKSFSLLSSASASGQTYTVSGLSGYDIIMVVVNGLSANGDWQCGFRINTDTGSNYSSYGLMTVAQSGYSSAVFRNINFVGQTYFPCVDGAQASSQADICFMIFGANSTGPKVVHFNNGQGTQVANLSTYQGMGVYSGGSVVSSISLRQLTSANTWDNGTVNVYGAI